jgi:hypothetical protein
MLRVDKIIKPWKESAALNDHINLNGFWSETEVPVPGSIAGSRATLSKAPVLRRPALAIRRGKLFRSDHGLLLDLAQEVLTGPNVLIYESGRSVGQPDPYRQGSQSNAALISRRNPHRPHASPSCVGVRRQQNTVIRPVPVT